MPVRQVARAFAPASVANLSCGFDVLGLALAGMGDHVRATRLPEPGVRLNKITGDGGRLSCSAQENTAGVAVKALLARHAPSMGVGLELHKGLPLESGLGSSAASAAAAVVAAAALLETPPAPVDLLACALEGERLAAGSGHADNASLNGGLILVRGGQPPDVISLPIPKGMSCGVVCPGLQVATGPARALMGREIPLERAVVQWGNLAGLVSGLYCGDWERISRCLVDVIAERVRSRHIPGFSAARRAALDGGAVGCGLAGSGPAMFVLCRNLEDAERASLAMSRVLEQATKTSCARLVCGVGAPGARLISAEEDPCSG
ncbi:MAG: homoserine kinase [Acidobacteriota bacterium]